MVSLRRSGWASFADPGDNRSQKIPEVCCDQIQAQEDRISAGFLFLTVRSII